MRLRSFFHVLMTALVIVPTLVHAQTPAGARPLAAGIGEIRGKLADSASGQPVTSGSITVRRAGDSAFAGGSL
ncbi:MAG: hypothetical protein ABJE47_12900, partial [bacterium]